MLSLVFIATLAVAFIICICLLVVIMHGLENGLTGEEIAGILAAVFLAALLFANIYQLNKYENLLKLSEKPVATAVSTNSPAIK